MATGTLSLPSRTLDVVADADVCVVGGGPAGLGAALSAARLGASVCLLERFPFLGGNFTRASVGAVCGLYVADGDGAWDYVSAGIAAEVAEQLKSAGAAYGPVPFGGSAVLPYLPWAAKRLFDELTGAEARIRLLLHAPVADAVVSGDRVDAVVVASKQGLVAVTARAFIDASGDADLVWFAGGRTELGPADARQHASMQFVMQGVDTTKLFDAMGQLRDLIAAHGAHLTRDSGALIPTGRPGEVLVGMTRVSHPDGAALDATRLADITYGEVAGRRIAEETAQFLVDHAPGFADAFLADTAALGVRESRRVAGQYTLTGSDVRGLARFDDAVAAAAWPLEFHVKGRESTFEALPPGGYYQVPLRALRPAGLANVLVAGRCASADHDALASLRVMGPSMVLGQAAGTAAALGLDGDVSATDVQAQLRKDGAFLGDA